MSGSGSTATQWIAALQAMTVTGVTRHYDAPPYSIHTADLPALMPLNFTVTASPPRALCTDLDKIRTADLLLAIDAVNQDTPAANYEHYKTLMDAFEDALDALTVEPFIEYTLRTTTTQEVANTGYWGIVATVTGRTTNR